VGDVEPGDVFRKARTAFGTLPRGTFHAPPLVPPAFAKPGALTEARKLETNYVERLFPSPHPGEPDYPASRVAMNFLSYRLFEEVRTKRNLSYAPYAGVANGAVTHGLLYVTAVDPKTTLKVMDAEVARLKGRPLSPKELTDTKEEYLSNLVAATETTDAQANFLTAWRLYSGDFREARRIPDRIRSVTAAEVQAYARKYLVNMQTAYVGDPSKLPAGRTPVP
jgi:predicted Zn-dependent peptidase